MNAAEQAQGVHEARESHALKLLSQIEARKNRLKQENMALVFPEPEKLAASKRSAASSRRGSRMLERAQHEAEARLPALEEPAPRPHRAAAGGLARARRAGGVVEGVEKAGGTEVRRFRRARIFGRTFTLILFPVLAH